MDNYDIFKLVLAQVLRHFLSIAAGMLAAYGVSGAMQGQLVEASVAIAIGVIVFLVSQAWAYISKRIAINQIPPNG